jgi:hypothetical protein
MSLKAEQMSNTEFDHIRDTLTGVVTFASKTRGEMHQRFDQQDKRFDDQVRSVNKRFDYQDSRFEQQDREFSQFKHEVQERFTGIENTLSAILAKL